MGLLAWAVKHGKQKFRCDKNIFLERKIWPLYVLVDRLGKLQHCSIMNSFTFSTTYVVVCTNVTVNGTEYNSLPKVICAYNWAVQ